MIEASVPAVVELGLYPVEIAMQVIDGLASTTGMPYWASIITITLILRSAMLPLAIVTTRNSARMGLMKPEQDALKQALEVFLSRSIFYSFIYSLMTVISRFHFHFHFSFSFRLDLTFYYLIWFGLVWFWGYLDGLDISMSRCVRMYHDGNGKRGVDEKDLLQSRALSCKFRSDVCGSCVSVQCYG